MARAATASGLRWIQRSTIVSIGGGSTAVSAEVSATAASVAAAAAATAAAAAARPLWPASAANALT